MRWSKDHLISMEIRWSFDHLISMMGFPILVRSHLYIEWLDQTYFYQALIIKYVVFSWYKYQSMSLDQSLQCISTHTINYLLPTLLQRRLWVNIVILMACLCQRTRPYFTRSGDILLPTPCHYSIRALYVNWQRLHYTGNHAGLEGSKPETMPFVKTFHCKKKHL